MFDHLCPSQHEVVVWKPERLRSNTHNLLDLINDLEYRGTHFQSLSEKSATAGVIGRALLARISAVEELEHGQLAERTKVGWPASHGRKIGRREVTTEYEEVKRAREIKDQEYESADNGRFIGVSRATAYRDLHLDEE